MIKAVSKSAQIGDSSFHTRGLKVVTAAVMSRGSALKHAHSSLHRDRQLLLTAGWHAPSVLVSTWSSEADSPKATASPLAQFS